MGDKNFDRTQWIRFLTWTVCVMTVAAVLSTGYYTKQLNKNAAALEQDTLEKEVAYVRRNVGQVSRSYAIHLAELAQALEARKPEAKAHFLQSDFSFLSLLKPNAQGQWEPQWVEAQSSLVKRLPLEALRTMVLDLPFSRLPSGEASVIWHRVQQTATQPLFAAITRLGDQQIAVGFLAVSALSPLAEPFKGSSKEFFVVDGDGFALAYTRAAYVGSSLKAVPEVLKVLESKGDSALTSPPVDEGKLLAWQRIPNSNLTIGIYQPLQARQIFNFSYFVQAWLLSLGIGGLLLVGILGFTKRAKAKSIVPSTITAQQDSLPVTEPAEPAQPVPLSAALNSLDFIEKPDAEEKNTFARALRGPIMAILGHVQMARGKASTEIDLKAHFDVIEDEARKMTVLLEGTEDPPAKPEQFVECEVEDVIEAALAHVKPEASGVKVSRKFLGSVKVRAPVDELQQAFAATIRNAVQGMALSTEKELEISITKNLESADITIRDTGCGIAKENLEKVFEAFFSEGGGERAGLGLTLARGTLQRLGGKIELDSDGASWTKANISLPLVATQGIKPNLDRGHEVVSEPIFSALDLPDVRPVVVPAEDSLSVTPVLASKLKVFGKNPVEIRKPRLEVDP